MSLCSPAQDLVYYLVKWCSLPYEDSTWELKADVEQSKIEEFEQLQAIKADVRRVVRGAHTRTATRAHTRIQPHTRTTARAHTRKHAQTYSHTHAHIYRDTRNHMCMRIHVPTYSHTLFFSQGFNSWLLPNIIIPQK